jgi:hypothetical protein
MKTTHESTGEVDRLIDLMPPEHAALVRRACDCYGKVCKKAQAMRDAKTTQCEAKVLAAIQAKHARLEIEPRHNWTGILMSYFSLKAVKIDEETVRRVCKSFPGFL